MERQRRDKRALELDRIREEEDSNEILRSRLRQVHAYTEFNPKPMRMHYAKWMQRAGQYESDRMVIVLPAPQLHDLDVVCDMFVCTHPPSWHLQRMIGMIKLDAISGCWHYSDRTTFNTENHGHGLG